MLWLMHRQYTAFAAAVCVKQPLHNKGSLAQSVLYMLKTKSHITLVILMT